MRYQRSACAAAMFAMSISWVMAADLDSVVVLTGNNRLVTLDLSNPGAGPTSAPRIKGLAEGEKVLGIDHRPANGRLYAVTSAGRILTVKPGTGRVLAEVALTGATLSGAGFGLDFNPVPDRLRLVSDANQNLRSNVDTGATFSDLALKGFAATAAYTNSFGTPDPTRTTRLFGIDSVNDQLYLQNPPNNGTLTPVGALGVDVTAVNGFDIAGPDDTVTPADVVALAVLSTTGTAPVFSGPLVPICVATRRYTASMRVPAPPL